jgi:hypothetical protein
VVTSGLDWVDSVGTNVEEPLERAEEGTTVGLSIPSNGLRSGIRLTTRVKMEA